MPFGAITVASDPVSQAHANAAFSTAVANYNLIRSELITLITALRAASAALHEPAVPVDRDAVQNTVDAAYAACIANLP